MVIKTWIAFILVMLSTYGTAAEQELPQVTWAIIPYAPIHILEGEFKGEGIADGYVENAQQSLPEYQHISQPMTPARAWQLIADSEELVCHPTALKTREREQIAYFSTASIVTPSIRILMRKSDWKQRLQGRNNLSFEEYISAMDGPLGVVKLRSYGQLVDDAIEQKFAGSDRLIKTSGQYGSRQLYEMLLSDRIDMMIEYPWVSAYFSRLSGRNKTPLVSLTISDFPSHAPAYVACNKTEEGRFLVEKISEFINKSISGDLNRARMKRWLDVKSADEFDRAYRHFFQLDR